MEKAYIKSVLPNMKTIKLLFLFFLFASVSHAQKSSESPRYTIPNAARRLNDSAMNMVKKFNDRPHVVKAISLLDMATAIDTNYFIAYNNKLVFQSGLKQYESSIATLKHLIRLKPAAPDFYVTGGVFYEKLGDSITAKKYFRAALTRYDKLLDTMDKKNKSYTFLMMNKGVNLILLGDQAKGQQILKQLYDSSTDDKFRQGISMFMNKTRREIIAIGDEAPAKPREGRLDTR